MGLFGKGKKTEAETFEDESDFSSDESMGDDADFSEDTSNLDDADTLQSSDFDSETDEGENLMEEEDSSLSDDEYLEQPKKKSSLGLMVILLAVLGGGGFYGYKTFVAKNTATGEAALPSPAGEQQSSETPQEVATTKPLDLPEKIDTPNAEDPSSFVKPIEEAPPQPTGFLNNPDELKAVEEQSEKALDGDGVLVPMVDDAEETAPATDNATPYVVQGKNPSPQKNTSSHSNNSIDGGISPNLPTAGDITKSSGEQESDTKVTTEQPQESDILPQPEDGQNQAEPTIEEKAQSDAQIKDLEGTIETLNGRVQDLEAKVAEQKSLLEKKSAEHSPIGSSEQSKKRKKHRTYVENTAPKIQWELRSAQEGRALISKVGDNEMTSVSVGETVEGIGRVESITLDAATGVWVVQGAKGKIVQ